MKPGVQLAEHPLDGPVPRFELEEWRARYGVVAGITGRRDGFNLGLLTPEPADRVLARWRTLAATLSPAFTTLTVGLQVHGARIAVHHAPPAGWHILDATDGHATRAPGVLLGVTVADCVPVYLLHPDSRTVGLLHAGWRGVAADMLEAGIARVCELAEAPEVDLVMHCGVGICGGCYEVGPEVHGAVTGTSSPQGPLDLREALEVRARARGLRAVTRSPWCAAHHGDRFFSHRRSGGRDGRMLAYLGVPRA